MPYYCFTTEDGETHERFFPMGGVPPKIRVGNKVAKRDYSAEHVVGFVKGTQTPVKQGYNRWPQEPCFASGVHPNQSQELRDFFKKNGLDVEVTKNGDPIYKSAAQKRKALKLRGFHERNSFLG